MTDREPNAFYEQSESRMVPAGISVDYVSQQPEVDVRDRLTKLADGLNKVALRETVVDRIEDGTASDAEVAAYLARLSAQAAQGYN